MAFEKPGRAVPVYIGSVGQETFAWIHPVESPTPSAVGAVLCAPFGREELSAHRTMLHLAEAAVASGLPTLRFDYHGTGDSAGHDTQPDRLAAWLQSVREAIDALKARTGVQQVCLIGMRLGASLAALAAEGRDDVLALVAITPVVSGRVFMRETRLLAGTGGGAAAMAAAGVASSASSLLEAGGFVLTRQTQQELGAIDLTQVALNPRLKILTVDRDDAPSARPWHDHCAAAGTDARYLLAPGYLEMMGGTSDNAVGLAIVQAVGNWLQASDFARTARREDAVSGNAAPYAAVLSETAQPTHGVREEPVAVDGAVPLAAILSTSTSSSGSRQSQRDGVILLSAGIARRIGVSRLHVNLARAWAAQGVAVMRLDLSGIGDSPKHPDHSEQSVYAASALSEVQAAVRHLRDHAGVTQCHLVGMCSGSYHALKAAAAGADVKSLVMINPMTFQWEAPPAAATGYSDVQVTYAVQSYARFWKEPKQWRRLVRGEVDIRRTTQTVLQRVRMGAHSTKLDVARLLKIRIEGDLGLSLEHLAGRGIAMHFVFSANEPGAALLATAAGNSVGRLERRRMLTQTSMKTADHIFTTVDSRLRLAKLLTDLLSRSDEVEPHRLRMAMPPTFV